MWTPSWSQCPPFLASLTPRFHIGYPGADTPSFTHCGDSSDISGNECAPLSNCPLRSSRFESLYFFLDLLLGQNLLMCLFGMFGVFGMFSMFGVFGMFSVFGVFGMLSVLSVFLFTVLTSMGCMFGSMAWFMMFASMWSLFADHYMRFLYYFFPRNVDM